MPFCDDLVKCDECGQYVIWWAVTRKNGYKYCKDCAPPDEEKMEDENGSKED